MRKANYRPPFAPGDFEEAIASLRNGKIPDSMDDLKAYINHTTRELVTYAQAVTECAVRQKRKSKPYAKPSEKRRACNGKN